MIVKELLAKFGLDFDQSSFDKADSLLNGVIQTAGGLMGLFASSKMTAWAKDIAGEVTEAASQIRNAALQIGIGTQAFQELAAAAKLADIDASEFNSGMRIFTRTIGNAARGEKSAAEGFTRLGIGLRNADGSMRSTDDLLMSVSDRMAMAGSATERAAIAQDLFGRGGIKMVNMLGKGSKAIQSQMERARELGGIIDGPLMEATDVYEESQKELNMVLFGFKIAITRAVIGPLTATVRWFTELGIAIRKVLEKTKLVEMAFYACKGAALALAAVSVFVLLGQLGRLGGTVLNLAGLFGKAGGAALLMNLKAMAMGLAMLALAGIILLIGEDIYQFFTGGDSVIGRFSQKLTDLVANFIEQPLDPNAHWLIKLLWYVGNMIDWCEGKLAELVYRVQNVKFEGAMGKIAAAGEGLWNALGPGMLTNMIPKIASGGIWEQPMLGGSMNSPMAGGPSSQVSNRRVEVGGITIIQQPGQDAKSVAEAVRNEMQSMLDDATTEFTPYVPAGATGGSGSF